MEDDFKPMEGDDVAAAVALGTLDSDARGWEAEADGARKGYFVGDGGVVTNWGHRFLCCHCHCSSVAINSSATAHSRKD